jgi:hypothetical protein
MLFVRHYLEASHIILYHGHTFRGIVASEGRDSWYVSEIVSSVSLFARRKNLCILQITLSDLEAFWVLQSGAAPTELGAALRHALAEARRRSGIAIAV